MPKCTYQGKTRFLLSIRMEIKDNKAEFSIEYTKFLCSLAQNKVL